MSWHQRIKARLIGNLVKSIKKNVFSFRGLEVEIHPETEPSVAYLIWVGRYELPECTFVEKYIEPNFKVVELGASTGILSALIQRQIGPKGRHVAVEANAALLPYIVRNAGKAVTCINAAIDYTSAAAVRFSVTNNTLSGRLLAADEIDETATIVPTTTLQAVIDDHDMSNCVLVMDIEGVEFDLVKNEPAALKSCQSIIAEIHPVEDGRQNFDEVEFFELLTAAGFVERDRYSRVVYLTRDET